MTLTDDDVRAIDAAAEVLRRVVRERGDYAIELFVRVDGRVTLEAPDRILHCDLAEDSAYQRPGEALRRLVGR